MKYFFQQCRGTFDFLEVNKQLSLLFFDFIRFECRVQMGGYFSYRINDSGAVCRSDCLKIDTMFVTPVTHNAIGDCCGVNQSSIQVEDKRVECMFHAFISRYWFCRPVGTCGRESQKSCS